MPRRRSRGALGLALALAWLGCATRGEPGTLRGGLPEGSPGVPVGSLGASSDAPPDPLFGEDEGYELPPPTPDPLEPANRACFSFNQKVDAWFWSPLTDAYQFLAPEPVRRGVHRVFENLNSPVSVVNNLIQLRLRDAGETLGSFVLNSTLGIVGFFEPSREAGWKVQPADFGQTLDLLGFASGPYLVLPVFGPTTVRDGIGSAVDRFFQPLTYVLGLPTQILWGGGAGLSEREAVDAKLKALQKSSVDFYSVMRSAYLQDREKKGEDARARRAEDLSLLRSSRWLCTSGEGAAAQD